MHRSARVLALLAAVAAGAGAITAYFLDPANGKRRRHQVRDRQRSRARHVAVRCRRTARYATSQIYGYSQRALHSLPQRAPELDDATLAHKVESIIFRDHSVPKGRINVNAESGVVYLRGQLDRPELIRAIETRARRISGVKGVVSLLHLPGTPVPDRQ
jgi:osmotically-inducible protein OsmY